MPTMILLNMGVGSLMLTQVALTNQVQQIMPSHLWVGVKQVLGSSIGSRKTLGGLRGV